MPTLRIYARILTVGHQEEARKSEAKHRELLTKEPIKFLGYGMQKWQSWSYDVNQAERDSIYSKKAAQDALEGKSSQEQYQQFNIGVHSAAKERLKNEHPELFKIFEEAKEREAKEYKEKVQRLTKEHKQKKELQRQQRKSHKL